MTGEQFKAKREALGWTQRATAEALGISLRTVLYYEAGKVPVSKPVALLFSSLVAPDA